MQRGRRQQWSRIDYFLVSDNLCNMTIEADIVANVNLDHSLISITVEASGQKRGLGSWKVNDEILNDREFVEKLNNFIQGVRCVYEYLTPLHYGNC